MQMKGSGGIGPACGQGDRGTSERAGNSGMSRAGSGGRATAIAGRPSDPAVSTRARHAPRRTAEGEIPSRPAISAAATP